MSIVKFITEKDWRSEGEIENDVVANNSFYPGMTDKFHFVASAIVDAERPISLSIINADGIEEAIDVPAISAAYVDMTITDSSYEGKYRTALENSKFFEVGNELIAEEIITIEGGKQRVTNIISKGTDAKGDHMVMTSFWLDSNGNGSLGRYICR